MTTVGFGDIVPTTPWGKVLATLNSIVGLAAFGFLIACITAALQPSEFQGTGNANITSSFCADAPKAPEQAANMILSSLKTLLEQTPPERHIHIGLPTSESQKLGAVVEVHVFIHCLQEDG